MKHARTPDRGRNRGFYWFCLLADGGFEALDPQQQNFDGNFIVVPEERLQQINGTGHEFGTEPLHVESSSRVAKLRE
jgi:hypothetical protein